jgi:hypothetical protein
MQAAGEFALAYRLPGFATACPSMVKADGSQMRTEGSFYYETEEMLA